MDLFETDLELVQFKTKSKGMLYLNDDEFGLMINKNGCCMKINPVVAGVLFEQNYNFMQVRKNPYTSDILLVFSKTNENDACLPVRRKTYEKPKYGVCAYIYSNELCSFLYKYINGVDSETVDYRGSFNVGKNVSSNAKYITFLIRQANK